MISHHCRTFTSATARHTDHYKFRTILLNVNFLSISDLRFCCVCRTFYFTRMEAAMTEQNLLSQRVKCDHSKTRNLFIIISISLSSIWSKGSWTSIWLALEFHWDKCMAINLRGEKKLWPYARYFNSYRLGRC